MIVLDASAMVEALVGAAPSDELLGLLGGDIHAPHLLDVEVASVLRGLELGRVITPECARQALNDNGSFTIERHEMDPLSEGVWELRPRFTSYYAAYIALAEALGAPVGTCDRKLLARGHRADVELVGQLQIVLPVPGVNAFLSRRAEPFVTAPEPLESPIFHLWVRKTAWVRRPLRRTVSSRCCPVPRLWGSGEEPVGRRTGGKEKVQRVYARHRASFRKLVVSGGS